MSLADALELARFRLVDDWPWRVHARRAATKRAALQPALRALEPLAVPREIVAEVHMLSGDAQADMGLLAASSLLRFLPDVGLVVHSDGRLSERGRETFTRALPFVRFVERAESDAHAEAKLARWPGLLAWRKQNWAAAQTVDFFLHARSERVIGLDTDVACFARPVAVTQWLSGEPVMRWNEDLVTRYTAPVATLSRIVGHPLPERLNCGFLLSPRLGDGDFERLERDLRAMAVAGLDMNQLWSSQTYLALMADGRPGSCALPPEYRVHRGPTPRESVLRHYVGMPSVRFRLFTEAWPRVLSA